MRKIILTAIAATAMTATPVLASDIVGTWKRPSTGTLVKYAPCGSNYCSTVLNGKFKGKSIGTLTGSGKNYKGTVTNLSEGKTYTGKATVTGNTLNLRGCVAGGLICKGEKWARQ